MINRLNIDQIRSNFEGNASTQGYFIAPKGKQPVFKEPYRTSTYGVGLVEKGSIGLIANLKEYQVSAPGLILMGPEVIRQWILDEKPIITSTFFFTDSFLLVGFADVLFLRQFSYFAKNARHFIPLQPEEQKRLQATFQALRDTDLTGEIHKDEIIRHTIISLLFRINIIYQKCEKDIANTLTANDAIVNRFKSALAQHFVVERSVQFYADQLSISSKHLSQVIKDETGQTASEWINHVVVLEAKVLLQLKESNVAEVAHALNFADTSFFGKYFKRHTGITPGQYRKSFL